MAKIIDKILNKENKESFDVKGTVISIVKGAIIASIPMVLIVILIFVGVVAAVSWFDDAFTWDEDRLAKATVEKIHDQSTFIGTLTNDDVIDLLQIDRKSLSRITGTVISYNKGKLSTYTKVNIQVWGHDTWVWKEMIKNHHTGTYSAPIDQRDIASATGDVTITYMVRGDKGSSVGTCSSLDKMPAGATYIGASETLTYDYYTYSYVKHFEERDGRYDPRGAAKSAVISTDSFWLYTEYPMDWKYIYLFSVYNFFDIQGMEAQKANSPEMQEEVFKSNDAPEDLDKEVGAIADNFEFATISKKTAREMAIIFMPHVFYKKTDGARYTKEELIEFLDFTTKNFGDCNYDMASMFDALLKHKGVLKSHQSMEQMNWWQKLRKVFKGNTYEFNDNGAVQSLFTKGWLIGDPITVNYTWYENETKNYIEGPDEYTEGTRTTTQHQAMFYLPRSSIDILNTFMAEYHYMQQTHPVANFVDPRIQPFGAPINLNLPPNKIEILSRTYSGGYYMKEVTLSEYMSGSAQPIDYSFFNITPLINGLDRYTDERKPDELQVALNEVPGGAKAAQLLEIAIYWHDENEKSLKETGQIVHKGWQIMQYIDEYFKVFPNETRLDGTYTGIAGIRR